MAWFFDRHGTLKANYSTWIQPVAYSLAIMAVYLAATVSTRSWVGVSLLPSFLVLDMLIHVAVAFPLFLLTRSRVVAIGATAVLFLFFHLANAGKLFFLNTPLHPGDVLAFSALVRVLPAPMRIAVLLLPAVMLILVLGNLRRNALWVLTAVGVLVATWTPVLVAPQAVLNVIPPAELARQWDAAAEFRVRGLGLFLYEQVASAQAGRVSSPSRGDVLRSVPQSLSSPVRDPDEPPSRNVHVLLVESLWDANLLHAEGFNRDPFHPDFRELWEETDQSTALAPTFGGVTANSEFELLCGIPVPSRDIPFMTKMGRRLPCLPMVLGESGYFAIASHPNAPNFWGRLDAYSSLGLEQYIPRAGFHLGDRDGPYLSDESLLRQNRTHIDILQDDRHLFNYVLTIALHFPYPRDEGARPQVVSASSQNPLVIAYANALYYTTKALADHVFRIRDRDPDALIVVVGDHLPVLGDGFGVFARSNLFSGRMNEFDADMIARLLAVPMLVIDGRAGPQKLGAVPMYMVPEIIRQHLGLSVPSAGALFHEPDDPCTRRPFSGMVLENCGDGWRTWHPNEGAGANPGASSWMETWRVLANDLLVGSRHVISLVWPSLSIDRGVQRVSVVHEPLEPLGPCRIVVDDWGPRSTERGTGFLVQADGSSAFWFRVREANDSVTVVFRGRELPTVQSGASITARVDRPRLLNRPGRYPVILRCDQRPGEFQIGTFAVEPTPGNRRPFIRRLRSGRDRSDAPRPYAECRAIIEDWGPRSTTQGTGFLVQADGSSALWFQVKEANDLMTVVFRGRELPTAQSGTSITARIDDPELLWETGDHPVLLRCTHRPGDIRAGTFSVHPD